MPIVETVEEINKLNDFIQAVNTLQGNDRKSLIVTYLIITIASSIITLFVVYGLFIEPKILLVNELKIESKNIPKYFDGIKIVHFSDLHYENTISTNNIDKVIAKINSLNPDIVIFTGDLIDNKYNTIFKITDIILIQFFNRLMK